MEVRVHRLCEVRRLGEKDFVLELEGPFPTVRPGAFAMLSLVRDWPCLLPRPFSYFDLREPTGEVREEGPVFGRGSFLVKVVGPGTAALTSAPPGSRVRVTGPLGRGFPAPMGGKEPVCLAGGVGLAPFLLWARERAAAGAGPIPLLYGGRNARALVGREEFEEGLVDWRLATDDGSLGSRGTVLDLYRRLVGEDALDGEAPVLCCGPEPMMAAVAAECRNRDLPCMVSLETVMACGYGVCNGCSVEVRGRDRFEGARYAKACVDGPVFDARELRW